LILSCANDAKLILKSKLKEINFVWFGFEYEKNDN